MKQYCQKKFISNSEKEGVKQPHEGFLRDDSIASCTNIDGVV